MTCDHCPQPARYAVTGRRQKRHACDQHLHRAQRDAGVPRSTTLIEQPRDGGQLALELGGGQ